jgi:UDP-N-acetylmuramoylalanine-D-glutamate ligase
VNYKSHVEGDSKTVDVKAKYAEFSLKQEFGVTVGGDLNEQEVKDLEKLFRKVANIFKQYLNGHDDEALAKTAKLAERFGRLSSLSGLDLNVDVERSVTVLVEQVV